LRALDVMRRVPVLALPRSSDHGASVAWRIVKPALADLAGQERLFLTFPMSKDPARLVPAWDKAFAAIGERLEHGLDVAFATEGDPSLFSTFIYLRQEAPRRWPGIVIETVPGVSSITAVPAVTGIPLADGQERIAIIPGTYGLADLTGLLRDFDTVVLMKIGPEMPRIIAALEDEGILASAVYVSKATMAEQRVVRDLRTLPPGREDCFAMVVVSRKQRSGVLAGAVPFREVTL
jgi:precorrin-2/cobalt-factor-2 C20-methyltransferase